MNARSFKRVRLITDERGATLVIVVIFLPVLLIMAAFAIDPGNWYTHHSHLQTQADAAALAAAQDFQFPCTPGGAMDEQIAIDVHHYDGTQTGAGNYNQQIPAGQPHGGAEYKLTSLINAPNFYNQSTPKDTISSSPCAAGAIDVKLTESNLPWYLQLLNVNHINAQARVSIENLTSVDSGLSPLAEPLPTPNAITAYLIDEGNNNAVLATVNLSPKEKTNDASWTATDPSFTFNATGPVGMEIAAGAGPGAVPCENAGGNSCYDTADSIGINYTRVWSNSGSPGLPLTAPAQPQASDVWLVPSGTGCGTGPGSFSNFISTASTSNVQLCASMTFTSAGGTALSCATASLTTKAGGTTYTMSCPSGGPNGTWTSAAVPVTPSSGPITFSQSWTLTTGKKPAGTNVTGGDSTGNCTSSKSCQGSFDGHTAASPEVVQRVFSGAYDSQSATSSHSGGILAASLTNTSSGAEIQSIAKGTTVPSVTINVNVLSFQNSQTIESKAVELSFGGNQANASVSCPGESAGGPQLERAIVSGCVPPNNNFELDSNFSSEPCNPLTNATTGAALCLPEISGEKLDKRLDTAMNTKINGSKNAKCTAFNYWAPGNTIPQLLDARDPRLIKLVTTDYGVLGNGRAKVPIRAVADFYVTGWKGDPCTAVEPGESTVNGGTEKLHYTKDEEPNPNTNENDPAGVLLGHFVQYTELSSEGTGSGQCQQSTSLGNCIAILTK